MTVYTGKQLSRIASRQLANGTPTTDPGVVNCWVQSPGITATLIGVAADTAACMTYLAIPSAVRFRYLAAVLGTSSTTIDACVYTVTKSTADTVSLKGKTKVAPGFVDSSISDSGNSRYTYVFDFKEDLVLNPFTEQYFVVFKPKVAGSTVYFLSCGDAAPLVKALTPGLVGGLLKDMNLNKTDPGNPNTGLSISLYSSSAYNILI